MKRIEFFSLEAQRIYDTYISRCVRSLAILSQEDKEDCLMELNSHIYEYIQAHSDDSEITRLLNALDRLGEPELTLREVIAAKKIDQAVRTFNIKHLIQALVLNVRNGLVYIVLSVMTLLLVAFPSLILLKILYPDDTGYFRGNGQNDFGYIVGHEGKTEVLGYWFIPIMLAFCAVLYAVIFLCLKLLRRK
jgi:hypothetical protein